MQGRRTEAKLGDLGLAKLIPDGHLALQHTLAATPAYSAPEVMQAQLSWRLRTQGRRDLFHTEVSPSHSRQSCAALGLKVIDSKEQIIYTRYSHGKWLELMLQETQPKDSIACLRAEA